MRKLIVVCTLIVFLSSFVSAEPLESESTGFDTTAFMTVGFCHRFGEANSVFKFENAFMGVDLYFSQRRQDFSMVDIKIPVGTISLENPFKIGLMVVPEHDPSMFWNDENRRTPRQYLPRLYGFVRNITSRRDVVVYVPLKPFFDYDDSRNWPLLIELRKLSFVDFRFFGGRGELIATGNFHTSGKRPDSSQFEGSSLNIGPGFLWTNHDQSRKIEWSKDYSEFSLTFEL